MSGSVHDDAHTTLIVIGAMRSGTKLIRDSIGSHPDVEVISHETDYIWQTDRGLTSDDEFDVESLTEQTRKRIVSKLERYRRGGKVLVEKTVANCLRVPFVDAVLPNAKYVHLVRDGVDTIESIHRQWTLPPDWRHLMGKVVSYPWWSDRTAFKISSHVAARVIRRLLGWRGDRAGTWGARYKGISEDVQSKELLEVCAIQWLRSVRSAEDGLRDISDDRKLLVQYEDFVANPLGQLEKVAEFLDLDGTAYQRCFDPSRVSQTNVGGGRRRLTEQELQTILPHVQRATNSPTALTSAC